MFHCFALIALFFDLPSAAVSVQNVGDDFDFRAYVRVQAREYTEGSSEYEHRRTLFRQRSALVFAQNSRPGRLWTAKLNSFSDRTDSELAQFRGLRHVHEASDKRAMLISQSSERVVSPLEEVDWTNLSMAFDVPDQKGCGSCWAVATSAMLQGRHEAATGQQRTFSAQQLVNCVPNPRSCGGDGGCQGATVELAMAYVEQAGLETTESVPYMAKNLQCNHPASTSSLSFLQRKRNMFLGLQSWTTLPKNKALPLMEAVVAGPVAISVAAEGWFTYDSGVFDGCDRDAIIDHAVVLFGYGKDAQLNKKFWNIRNSWGNGWGERGFIRLLRHESPVEDDAYCGTDTDPSVGLECKPYPKSVEVCGMCGMLYDSVAADFAM
eukprot:TRINITY_DN11410_c0_g3_i1.p1 TRINITY_DN11410_c0_g3~~TRINITY_DN11410_c0_g3_i1.p1  ORF type:complete len:379 (+),score=36.95 TRINITY_DN11410_c0_g3_i1:65-1201(+)